MSKEMLECGKSPVKEAVAMRWGRCWRDAVIGFYTHVKRDVKKRD